MTSDLPLEVLWAGVRFNEAWAKGHYCVFGMPGAGKTVQINGLLGSLLPRVIAGSDRRVVLFDPKNEYMALLRPLGLPPETPVYLLNPFDSRTCAWDIAADIRSAADCRAAAELFIPSQQAAADANQYFVMGARALAEAVLRVLTSKAPGVWNLRHLVCIMRDAHYLEWVLRGDPNEEAIVSSYLAQDPRTVGSLVSTASNFFNDFSTVAALFDNPGQSRRRVSLERDWLGPQRAGLSSVVVLGYPVKQEAATERLNALLFYRLRQLIADEEETHRDRHWIVIDELPRAGFLRGLDNLLAEGRSKGGRVVIGIQDLKKLRAGWVGRKEAAEAIPGLCLNLSILRLNCTETAEWASKRLGKTDLKEYKKTITNTSGKGGGRSEAKTTERVLRDAVLPGQFMNDLEMSQRGILHGVHIVPAFKTILAGSYAKYRLYPAEKGEAFKKRPPEDERLKPLEGTELQKLLGTAEPPPPRERYRRQPYGDEDDFEEDEAPEAPAAKSKFSLKSFGRENHAR